MLTPYDKVSKIPGLGPKGSAALAKLGIITVQDLLLYFPFRYEDYSVTKPIAELLAGDTITVQAEIDSIEVRKSFKSHITITEAKVSDDSGSIKVKWFNQPFLEKTLRPGTLVTLSGKVDDRGEIALINPRYEKRTGLPAVNAGRILPMYSKAGGVGEKRLRGAIKAALSVVDRLHDVIPEEIRAAENFPPLKEAVERIHFPEDWDALQTAINRLKFDELFLHQLLFAQVKDERARQSANQFPVLERLLKDFVAELPFEMTAGQKRAAWEIVQDLAKPHPMNRMLEGDVGSGKNVVAAMAMYVVLAGEKQAAYLAPTEILATQQYAGLASYLGVERVALLTRTACEVGGKKITRKELAARLQSGEPLVVVATHALLQKEWEHLAFAFVVIDEQHRFGVRQRHELLSRGTIAPHLLSMSATPIPRSLALTIYGDLELSIITELPKNRKPIKTQIVFDKNQTPMYAQIKAEIGAGNRVYVVCPLIDPSDKVGAASVHETALRLKKGPLKGVKMAELHGRMKTAEKEEVMRAFKAGDISIVVSTTVVEVGVDVPEATVIIIEGAERFGLSQLHQLRGRVGRSDMQSYCYLRPTTFVQGPTRQRLEALVHSSNGFQLAEMDLQFRGPGNVFGDAQSGFPDFRLATLSDVPVMKKARDWAQKILEKDPELIAHPELQKHIKEHTDGLHLE